MFGGAVSDFTISNISKHTHKTLGHKMFRFNISTSAAKAAPVTPVAAPTDVPRTADGVNIANMPASSAAAAPAAAAPAAAPNYDTMPFGQAFGAARKAGAKDVMWKGKKYAVQMAPKPVQTASPKLAPKPAPLPGKTPFQGAGQISDNPAAEGRNTGIMKELNAMRRIAGLKDSGT